jgi:hypothetical protein
MYSAYKKLEAFPGLRRDTAIPAGWAILAIACAPLCFGQKAGQPTFGSPAQASEALFAAASGNNEQGMMRILGAGKELASSGDESQDTRDRERFVHKYDEMHRLARESNGTTVLYIGAENWPFPIPLASKAARWYFDSDAGAQEVFFRQIGEDEAAAIEKCRALVSGSQQESKRPAPLQGYYFRDVTGQATGNKAGSGIVVAYPAQYRSSGVMTFVATQDGKVYERDLGPNTTKLASAINAWQPDANWHLVAAE